MLKRDCVYWGKLWLGESGFGILRKVGSSFPLPAEIPSRDICVSLSLDPRGRRGVGGGGEGGEGSEKEEVAS